jgi:hypothetical protein
MTRDERLLIAISIMVDIYQPGKGLPPTTLRAWREVLKPYPIEAIEQAAKVATRQDRAFMPKPGELIALIRAADDRASRAWDRVDFAVRTVSEYGSPQFDDPVIGHVIKRIGGWSRLCNAKEAEFDNWIRREFVAEYQALQGQDRPPIVLNGLHARSGKEVQPTRVKCDYMETAPAIEYHPTPLPLAQQLAGRLSAPTGESHG